MAAGGVVEIIITAFATDFQFDGSGGFFFVQEHCAYAYHFLFRPGQREGRLAAYQRLSEHEIVFLVLQQGETGQFLGRTGCECYLRFGSERVVLLPCE